MSARRPSVRGSLLMEALVAAFILGVAISAFISAYGALERAKRLYTLECLAVCALDNTLERVESFSLTGRDGIRRVFDEECARQRLAPEAGAVPSSADEGGTLRLSIRDRRGTLLAETSLKCKD